MKKEKFSYRVSVTAPREYPAEVYIGYLADEKDFITATPKGMIERQGWTANGSDPGFGGNRIPTELEITWLSFAEKKFWKLQTTLPKDVILQKFQEGFKTISNYKNPKLIDDTYDSFVIGLAPGGVVVVWLDGAYHRVEIGRYQAQETSVSNNKFRPVPDPNETQEEFFDTFYEVVPVAIRDSISKNGIPYGLWDQYRKKYHWRFTTEFYDEQDKNMLQYHTYYNGEKTVLYEPDLKEHSFLYQAPPYRISLAFKENKVYIDEFDWKEISSAFELLSKDNPEAKIDIIVKPAFMYAHIDIWATNGKKEIPLKKSTVRVVRQKQLPIAEE